MSTEICIPGLGAGMAEGLLVEWHVQDGATVSAGDMLYTIESEKTAQDVESPAAGVIRLSGQAGETYAVGTAVATIE